MKTDKSGVWIRCWDGSEMEYEHFSKLELIEMMEAGISNYGICLNLSALPTLDFGLYLDDIRKGSKQLG